MCGASGCLSTRAPRCAPPPAAGTRPCRSADPSCRRPCPPPRPALPAPAPGQGQERWRRGGSERIESCRLRAPPRSAWSAACHSAAGFRRCQPSAAQSHHLGVEPRLPGGKGLWRDGRAVPAQLGHALLLCLAPTALLCLRVGAGHCQSRGLLLQSDGRAHVCPAAVQTEPWASRHAPRCLCVCC